MNDKIGDAHFDRQRSAYKSFFDHDWAGQQLDLTANTAIRSSVEKLLIQWKACSLTHALPWLLTEILQRHGEGLLGTSHSIAHPLIAAIDARLIQLVGKPLSCGMHDRIKFATNTLANEVLTVERQAQDYACSIDRRDEMWREFLEHREFCLTLWGCQRMCYASVYFAYEDFVRECISIATGIPATDDWTSGGKVVEMAETALGRKVTAQCLTNDRIAIARHARNCIVHAGGKVSPQLKALPHQLTIDGDILQIRAEDTVALFNDLRDRAQVIIEAMLRFPNPVPPS